MVSISPGGTNLGGSGRAIAHRAGVAPGAAGHGGPAISGTRGSPGAAALPAATPAVPHAQTASEAGRIAWSPARLLATLLDMLTAAGAPGGREADLLRRAGLPGLSEGAQPGGDGATQPRPAAGPHLIAALLRVLAGPVPSDPTGTRPGSTPAEKSADPTPQATQARLPQEMGAAIPRADLPAPHTTSGLPAAAVPQSASATPGEHPAPRAELVPPGDGVRGRNGVDLPLVPTALVALALPALAAVLASIF